MKNDEHAIAVVREWVTRAENDLLAATHLLKLARRAPTDVTCFHAQQCAEKYLKALLAYRDIDFPKTHDLDLLARRLPNGLRALFDVNALTALTPHATISRYPGGEPVSLAAARRILASARRVRARVRVSLPKRAIQKTGKARG